MSDPTPSETEKKRWPKALGFTIGHTLQNWLSPACERIAMAGSLRRGKLMVGDVEILYIPRLGMVRKPGEMFESLGNLAEESINAMLETGKLEPRLNVNGQRVWGQQNKLALHKATGMPVDLFSTCEDNWFVSLVIRTGPKELNIRLIESAKARGLQLHAYGAFTEIGNGQPIYPQSEREVFDLCGVPYLKPEERL